MDDIASREVWVWCEWGVGSGEFHVQGAGRGRMSTKLPLFGRSLLLQLQ